MPKKSSEANYCKAVVIVHGKSEYLLVQHIKSVLHLSIEIYGKKKGKNSIQINRLMKELNNSIFKSQRALLNNYEIEVKDKKLKNFKLFAIMDTDDCVEQNRDRYINKEMFNGHPLKEYIVPIYNINTLEDVIKKSGIYYKKIKDSEKGSTYIKLFPQESKKIIEKDDVEQLQEMYRKLKKIRETNLEELIKYCIDNAKLIE